MPASRQAADVHFVQIKCPLLTAPRCRRAGRGTEPVTRDTYESMGWSRGASALGVALALGEVAAAELSDAACCRLVAVLGRASASAGIELDHNVVIVLGEAAGSASPAHRHTVMRDAVDAASVRRLLREHFGIDPDPAALQQRLVNLLAKAEASPDGRVRGEAPHHARRLRHQCHAPCARRRGRRAGVGGAGTPRCTCRAAPNTRVRPAAGRWPPSCGWTPA
jgi:cyanuric acid amidohydrolase